MASDIYDMKHLMEARWNALRMILWLCVAPLLPLQAQEGISAFQQDIASMEQKAATGRMQGNARQSNASPSMDIRHYRCQWEIDPAQRYIRGSVTASFRLKSAASFVAFDLVDLLTVDSVRSGSASLAFTRPGNQSLVISFSSELPAGTDTSVVISYQGAPPAGAGFGSFSLSTHAGQPVLWTLSEPFGAMDWWPCKNGLDDKADSIDVILVTPEAYTGVANGLLVAERIDGGQKTTHWKHRYPISTYLVAIAATNYVTLRDSVLLGSQQMPIIQYVYPESVNNFQQAAAVTGRSLAMLHDAFGPYPFITERYGHTQFSWGGGMEHQTNSFMFNTNETLIVHEAAHQWFGNQVTCGGWPDIWLNEGFALFCTNYNLERFHPQLLPATLRAQLNSITSQPGGSVWVSDSTNGTRIFNSRLTYFKGGWLVRMLRWTLGDSAFFRGVRRYLNDPALRYGFARTADLQRNLEAESGVPLDEFFRDWFYGEGYPSYTLQWTPIGNGLVNTTLSQTTSHPSVAFFDMPVPIRFWNNQQDTTLVIAHQRQDQSTMFRLAFTPDSAAIDPDMFLVSAKNRVEKTLLPDTEPNTVSIFPNPVGSSFQVFLRNFQNAPLSLALYNAKGQLLWSEQQQQFSGNDIRRVDTGKLPAGVYFLRIQSGSNIRSIHKILK